MWTSIGKSRIESLIIAQMFLKSSFLPLVYQAVQPSSHDRSGTSLSFERCNSCFCELAYLKPISVSAKLTGSGSHYRESSPTESQRC